MMSIDEIERKLELARKEKSCWKINSHNYIMASKLTESLEKMLSEKLRELEKKG